MNIPNPENTVMVFDLDDTLYSEYEYKCSGIEAVICLINQLYPEFSISSLKGVAHPSQHDWLDRLCTFCHFHDSEKQALLWHYRLHQPKLTPYLNIQSLRLLLKQFFATAIITDGRSLTQRMKINSLGINKLFDDILISEAYRSEKPCDKRFQLLEDKYRQSNSQFIYVGDNIKKDFITPKKMGWLTIGLTAHSHNIHLNDFHDFPEEYHPHYWIKSLDELNTLMK